MARGVVAAAAILFLITVQVVSAHGRRPFVISGSTKLASAVAGASSARLAPLTLREAYLSDLQQLHQQDQATAPNVMATLPSTIKNLAESRSGSDDDDTSSHRPSLQLPTVQSVEMERGYSDSTDAQSQLHEQLSVQQSQREPVQQRDQNQAGRFPPSQNQMLPQQQASENGLGDARPVALMPSVLGTGSSPQNQGEIAAAAATELGGATTAGALRQETTTASAPVTMSSSSNVATVPDSLKSPPNTPNIPPTTNLPPTVSLPATPPSSAPSSSASTAEAAPASVSLTTPASLPTAVNLPAAPSASNSQSPLSLLAAPAASSATLSDTPASATAASQHTSVEHTSEAYAAARAASSGNPFELGELPPGAAAEQERRDGGAMARVIRVTKVTYGDNCAQGYVVGNDVDTDALAFSRQECDTKESCAFKVFNINFADGSEPLPGCHKAFKVTYACTGARDDVRHAEVRGANGRTIRLSCAAATPGSDTPTSKGNMAGAVGASRIATEDDTRLRKIASEVDALEARLSSVSEDAAVSQQTDGKSATAAEITRPVGEQVAGDPSVVLQAKLDEMRERLMLLQVASERRHSAR